MGAPAVLSVGMKSCIKSKIISKSWFRLEDHNKWELQEQKVDLL